MASIPQFYADFTLSGDCSQFLNNLNGLESYGGSAAFPDANSMQSNYPTGFDDYYHGAFNMYPADIPQASAISLPERFGISDVAAPEYGINYNDNKIGVCGDVNATQCIYNGEECCDFSPEFKPLFCPSTGDQNWGSTQEGKQIPATGETNSKVGKYSVEERKDRIMRYLKKKNQRNFNKTIKYVCRKTLADRRVRIRGRFARNNETCEQQPTSSMKNNDTKKEEEMYSGDDDLVQIEHDDRWLQEAMSNLMCFPYDTYVDGGDDHPKTWSL